MKIVSGLVACMLSGLFVAADVQAVTVTVNEGQTYQTITGLGGQHMSGWRVKQGPFYIDVDLDAIHFYDSLIQDLGVSLVRYFINLSTQPATPQSFTITTEARTNINYWLKLKAAANRAGFDLKVCTSILSAPIYMKWVQVDQSDDPDGMDPQYYDELGQHAVSYLKVAADTFGLVHYAFSPQNEPYFNEPYSQINYFNDATYTNMFGVVAPLVKAYAPYIKFFFPEHMGRLDWLTGPTWDRVLHDGTLAQYGDICAVHSYIDGVAPDLGSADGWTALYNNANGHGRPVWMTETSGYDGTTFAGGMEWVKSLYVALKYGCISGWSYLNMVSASSSDCFVNAGAKTHLYFGAKQFYRFARPSMVQVASNCADAEVRVVAFHQPARNGLGIIMLNLGASDKTADISITGSYVPTSYTVMRYSATDSNRVQTGAAPTGITLRANSVTSLWAGPDPIGISADATPVTDPTAAASAPRLVAAEAQLAVYDLSGRLVARQAGESRAELVRGLRASPRVYIYSERRPDRAMVTGKGVH